MKYLIQTQLMSLRAKGEAITFLGLFRPLASRRSQGLLFPRNDKSFSAFVLIIILIALSLIIPVFSTLRAEEVSLSLEEAISLALRDNRDVLIQAEEIKKAKAKISESKSGFLPTLTFSATQSNTRGLYSKDITQTTTQTTLKQYLYKGGKTTNTLAQSKFDLQVEEAILDKTKMDTVLQVKKAFYTLLLTDEYKNLNKNILDNTQKHLDYLRVLYQNGCASESDILQIKESLENVKQAYEESLNQLDALRVLLCNLLYLDEKVIINPNAEFIYDPVDLVYEEGFLRAIENRPEIKQYNAQEKSDQKAIEIAKAEVRPSIYASWDYYSRSRISAATAKNWNDYNVIGVTFSWPIFDGWLTKAKVDQAIVDLKETQLTKEKTIKDISLELKNAYIALKNAISQVRTTDAQISLYRENLSTVNEKYKKGLASQLDVEDINLSYEVALFNRNQAVYNYIIADSEFQKATGEIL